MTQMGQPRQRETVRSGRQGKGQEAAQGRLRPARDAAAELKQRQTRRQGRAEEGGEAGARARPIEERRIVQSPPLLRADLAGEPTSQPAQHPA